MSILFRVKRDFKHGHIKFSGIVLIILLVVDGGTDSITVKPYLLQKKYFNEFVPNVLRDNIGMIIFDLRGCGGC